ncbi:hypothetical protein B0H13DRAFT_911951 [Mycena leptocephala]|nr:hypothetical protein B0H13DRAFT_911951 [Mycena leptocephala]
MAPAQLSHYFPLPPTRLDTHGSQKSFATSNPSSSASLNKSSMSSLNDSKSLQETLDALWAPPKQVPIRISAPATPIAQHNDLLIDFSCESISTTSSFPTVPSSSTDTSMEISSDGVLSANHSTDASELMKTDCGGQMHRTQTLTQVIVSSFPCVRHSLMSILLKLLASHPELDLNLGPPESSPKQIQVDPTDLIRLSGNGPINILLAGDDEPIQLPPVTYADAANIASRYPELAAKVLNEPLATPVQAHAVLEPEEEAEHYFAPQEASNISVKEEPVLAMPAHTPDQPNWAVAPAAPEDYQPRPCRPRMDRDRGDYSRDYGRNSGRDRNDYGRRQSSGSGFQQDQNEFDAAWQYGGGGGRPSSQRNDSQYHSEQSRGHHQQEDYYNARNGPQRRGWSQEPSYGANDRNHDVPPHMRGRGDDSHDQSFHLPTRPSATRVDSMNTSARVDESAPAGVDEWGATHDPWAAPAEQRPDACAAVVEQKADAWAAPAQEKPAETRHSAPQAAAVDEWMPTHDPWATPAEQPAAARRESHSQPAPSSQSFRSEGERRDAVHTSTQHSEATAPATDEWMPNHDPWAASGDENKGHQQSQQRLEPENKREAPSSIRGGGSPFRDRMNNSTYQPDRSVNEAPFSANVLDVRAPSQVSVAALAAARASDMYDRPERPKARPEPPTSFPSNSTTSSTARRSIGRAPGRRKPRKTRFRPRRMSSPLRAS